MALTRDQERMRLLFSQNLKRAEIRTYVRLADPVQFENRRLQFDFDMIVNRWDQSLSPGNEQLFYFSAAAASEAGSRNYMGIKSEAIDAMIAAMLRLESRADLVSAVRAL